ncbi:MAG: class I tRNA ligase family protein [Candidatus Shikimatogenerans sp. Tser]|uniref:Class I tRNA ligase family protein n=1 Tax=Candidatus Shikimatogenerans sp. Tser TaxID=3158568 RepID=A0AAU7QQP6_9FLAO
MSYFKIFNYNNYSKFIKNINYINFIKKKNIYKKQYIIYEGPPSMNGKPGIHHLLSKIIKDIYVRYNFLKNILVKRKLG